MRTFIKKTHINQAILQNNIIYTILAKHIKNQNLLTQVKSIELLNKISPRPDSSSIVARKTRKRTKYDLKVIIPVYNSEKYINSCLQSVCNQKNNYKIKIQIINDGSTDDSIRIISRYSDERIHIVSQKNKGLSGARNTALNDLDSNYVMFLDSDDTLAEDSLRLLLDAAYKYDADIVEGSFDRMIYRQKVKGVVHKNLHDVKTSELYGFPWGKVIKTELFDNLQFPENYWFEDSIMSFLIYPEAENKVTISDSIYNYRYNLSGISASSKNDPKCIDTFWITELMLDEVNRLKIKKDRDLLSIFMAQIILNFRRTNNMSDDVKKAIFVCTVSLLKREFAQFAPLEEFKDLYNAVLKRDYVRYYVICSIS